MSEKSKRNRPKRIGEYLSPGESSIQNALQTQQQQPMAGEKRRLGDILIENQAITPDALREAIRRQRLDRLENATIFGGCRSEELDIISQWVTEISFESGEEFICQEARGECFYILVDGLALVFRWGDYGEEIPLAYVEPGESIGEMGYFSEGRRTASVKAIQATEALEIHYDNLDKIFESAPTLTKNFLAVVTQRLRRTNLRFQDVAEKGLKAERSLESLRRFLDMSEIATLTEGIEGLIERVVVTASKVMDADRASLFLVDQFSGELWSKVAEGVGTREIRIPVGRGIAGWVARHEEIINIKDAYQDSRFDSTVDEKTGYRTRTILCGPVKNLQGAVVGVIQVINKKQGAFTEKDEGLFKAFAYQTAVAVENYRLYRRLISSHEKMAILLDVASSVSETLNLDTLIFKIVNKTSEILDAERSTLFLVDDENRQLWSKVAQGSELKEIRFPMHLGLAGYVAISGQLLNIEDAYQDPRFNPSVDRQTGFRTRTVISHPVYSRNGKIIGVTQAINKSSGHFDKNDEDMLKALTSQIAVSLENAKLYQNTVRMKNYLASVQDSITNSIFTLDRDFKVVTLNKAALHLFGFTPQQVIGRDFQDILGGQNEAIFILINWIHTFQKPLVDYDVDLVTPNGEKHAVNLNFVPLLDADEQQPGFGTDI